MRGYQLRHPPIYGIVKSNPPTWVRTKDLSLKRRLLYQLSYGRVSLESTYFPIFFQAFKTALQELSLMGQVGIEPTTARKSRQHFKCRAYAYSATGPFSFSYFYLYVSVVNYDNLGREYEGSQYDYHACFRLYGQVRAEYGRLMSILTIHIFRILFSINPQEIISS